MPKESRDSKQGMATERFPREVRPAQGGGHPGARPEYGGYGEYGELVEEGELNELDELDELEEAGELGDETPEGDAVEQRQEVLRLRDEPLSERVSEEADPADAAEQARVVELDDEDYR